MGFRDRAPIESEAGNPCGPGGERHVVERRGGDGGTGGSIRLRAVSIVDNGLNGSRAANGGANPGRVSRDAGLSIRRSFLLLR